MYKRILFLGGLLVLGGAVILATPDRSQAGGRGGGGYHGGGYGGYHGGYYGGYHGGYYGYRGYYGGYRYPYYGYGYGGYYPFYLFGFGPSVFGVGYGGYGYGGSGYGGSGYGGYGYPDGAYASPGYAPGYAPGAAYPPPAPRPPDDSLPVPSDAPAQLLVRVPASAEVWFDGFKTTAAGAARRFHTPPLQRGNRYTYTISASWQEGGRSITQSQRVDVSAGANVEVAFPIQPGR
jgi:uncharacterized protein (TIGR03000 family)